MQTWGAKSPAQFIACAGLVDATLALLLASAPFHIPLTLGYKLAGYVVGHRKVFQLARAHVVKGDVSLGAFGAGHHLTDFGDACVTVLEQVHVDGNAKD